MKIVSREILAQNKYTKYNRTKFINKNGNDRSWEYLSRTNDTEAVVVKAETKDKVILVKQFRLPLEKYAIEFCAGLIDEGESPENAAMRELKEETGYSGKLLSVSPSLCTSAGITDEYIYFAHIEINGDKGLQELDDTEEIEVLAFNKGNIKKELSEYIDKHPDTVVDSKVWAAYCL